MAAAVSGGAATVPDPLGVTPEKWLDVIRREYLETFVRDGGSALKIAVPRDALARNIVSDGLAQSGSDLGFLVVQVDAAETRVHMMDQLFFQIAKQVPWRPLSEKVVTKLAHDKMFKTPQDGDGSLSERLAAANALSPRSIVQELRPAIERGIATHRRLSQDFRVAMSHLCRAELAGGEDGEICIRTIID